MTFIHTLIKLLAFLILAGLSIYFGGREIWLYMASHQVARDVATLSRPTRWKDVMNLCTSELITEGSAVEALQLRFISDTEYVLEVSCRTSEPVVKETKKLPYMVRKTTGTAGFSYPVQDQVVNGEITLELLGQTRVIYAEDKGARNTWGETLAVSSVPASVCVAHGFQCCDAVEQYGDGEQAVGGVTDCPANCYQRCVPRPVLLSLQTDPPFPYESRLVSLTGTSGLVLFSYTFQESGTPIESVKISYGDGVTDVLEEASGQVSKEYTCNTDRCVYTVQISAVDENGVDSATSRLSTVTVELVP